MLPVGLAEIQLGDTANEAGRANDALYTFASGIAERDLRALPDVAAAPALRGGLPAWSERVPYGSPAQNAELIERLMQAAGRAGTLQP